MAHFLKRLELNGFKSFANKTVLEFPEGITAVVGPNGSGKSNIVDAIRWLLGERDAKQLRGSTVEDLIFGGTPKRARLGQAQAGLHFENHEHFFPVEFSEVVVTREVRRDGASRYFLNKSEVLLRDLIDFFAKARLGSRGLIVVTQGNSDVFIQATPLGRREMIEEILGLREYELKKAETERRLKTSKINLEKVRALTEEILPHLRSLRRQTGRWEKRGALETELMNLENEFFGVELQKLEAKYREAKEKIESHEKTKQGLSAALKSVEMEQAQVEAAQPKEREVLRRIKAEIQELQEKRSRLQKEIGRLEVRVETTPHETGAFLPPPEETLKVLKRIKSLLESVPVTDTVALKGAVAAALVAVNGLLYPKKASQPTGAEEDDAVHALSQIKAELQNTEENLGRLQKKETELERGQESFYETFKKTVTAVEAAKDALEKWEMRHRELGFDAERVLIHIQEVERQVVQTGRTVAEFKHTKVETPSGMNHADLEHRIFRLRGDLAAMGDVDEAVMKEASQTEERYQFLEKESGDLEKAHADLERLLKELREKIHVEFAAALKKINKEFATFFGLMFGGGEARLKLASIENKGLSARDGSLPAEFGRRGTFGGRIEEKETAEDAQRPKKEAEEEDETEAGVEIEIKLPKKRVSTLDVLSGGERSLVGIAALFALISVSPPPFLVLDEIDAALDERNARRFSEMLKEFSKQTQFVVVTHNRATMEAADVLYGVTLDEDGTSKVLSLKLENSQVGSNE